MSGSEASDSEDEMYDVEKIVDERYKDEEGNDVEVQYRVRWKGFPPGDDTWEPLENLEESLKEVEAFKERRARRDRRREEKRIRQERLFNAVPDISALPAIPVFDVSCDIATRPLVLPKNFDENKWQLAEPFMCPFCGKINESQDHLRNHQLTCKPLKKVLVDVKKLQELRPGMGLEDKSSQESQEVTDTAMQLDTVTATDTVMSENEAPEMDELIRSPEKEHDASAVEKIAKEMGMNVMRVDDANPMPEMKELPQLELPAENTDSNMSVDICQNDEKNDEDPKEDPIIACAPDISSTDTAEEYSATETLSADEKQILAEKDLNKSMSDEEYKQFLYTPPKACSTQKSASQESNKSEPTIRKAEIMEERGRESPPTMEEMDLENDVYEELVETTVEEEDEPMLDPPPFSYYLIPLNFIKRS